MSNLEHLVENGIKATKENGLDGFNKAMEQQHNKMMLEMERDKISKKTLWEIVQYIVYSHDESLSDELLGYNPYQE